MSLDIQVDEDREVVTICGARYSFEIFRTLGIAPPGTWLRIEDRKDGVVTVFRVSEETERSFDAITGRGVHAA
jgi:hypothetical protein